MIVALFSIGAIQESSAAISFGTGVSLSDPDQNGWVHINGNGEDVANYHNPSFNLITVDGAQNNETINSPLKINQKPLISHSQFSIQATNGGTLNLTNDLDFNITAESISPNFSSDVGTYALYAASKGQLNITGKNISVEVRHNLSNEEQLSSIGANGLYLSSQSSAVIGQAGGTARFWVLAGQPDLISAKKGSSVTFLSTQNQLVGSFDMMDDPNSEGTGDNAANTISITLSGTDSYWFGDEKTWQNSTWDNGSSAGDKFNITLEDGAQWSYLSLAYVRYKNNTPYWAIPKRISEVTLNGGIINLFDENLQNTWKEIGLWDAMNNGEYDYAMHPEYKHDYVIIGNLQGSGGIFRMDLDAENKANSDMLFIESGSGINNTESTHYFEPYQLHLLKSISTENTLTFALVKEGSHIKFASKENLEGDGLWNYELDIASKTITEEDIDANEYWERSTTLEHAEDPNGSKTFIVNPSDYLNGQNWYIYRVTLHESEATQGITGAGWASYNAAVEMERHDRRLSETIRQPDSPLHGLWIRVNHGSSGAANQYRWDRTGITLGIERQLTDTNAAGAWFGYTEGDTDLLDVRGSGNMKRYEFALYDTLTVGANYLDVVGRLGRISSEISAVGNVYGTSGEFEQNYASISAEVGHTLTDSATGIFFEPQLQIQATYLDSFDYSVQRGIKIQADSDTSLIGRAGLRTGKQLNGANMFGEFYVRGDVLHQFTSGQNAKFLAPQDELKKVWGDLDTWCNFGVGGSFAWKNVLKVQFDLERTVGNKMADTWLMSGRLSYLF